MLKAKMPLIILLVLLIMSGFITFKFYSDNQNLAKNNEQLKKQKSELENENMRLSAQYKSMESQQARIQEKLDAVQAELIAAEAERDDFQQKYRSIAEEREKLAQKIKSLVESGGVSVTAEGAPGPRPAAATAPEGSGEYWADIVRTKAELEAKLEDFRNELIKTKTKIMEYEKDNKELSLRIDEMTKKNETLEREMAFKERTMEIMGRDLVSEREARKKISDELNKLRDENVKLKREFIVVNKERMNLQNNLTQSLQKKEKLEQTVDQVETILKEKTLLFSELEGQLSQAVSDKKADANRDSASVELPPIVVKSGASVQTARGEILAVNKNDNFVILDVGEDSGVRPGARFNVVRGDTTIGLIEVIETRKEISAADIKEIVSGFSIREGDTVLPQ